jgi:fatty-acyl-CoA synthase
VADGDTVGIFMPLAPETVAATLACAKLGAVYVPIFSGFGADAVANRLGDAGATVLLTADASPRRGHPVPMKETADLAADRTPGVRHVVVWSRLDRTDLPWNDRRDVRWDDVLAMGSDDFDTERLDPEHPLFLAYTSGTTGRPKGVRPELPGDQIDSGPEPLSMLVELVFGVGQDAVYLSPAPIYHAAPLRWSASIQAIGGTVVMMSRFDAEQALAVIAKYRVTHGQYVPTMFVRMLQLPDETRARYDVSSIRLAVHAAAPCPVEVKRRMIEWWGPVLVEYYAGTEGVGMTVVDSATWLSHPGTVGRSVLGPVHICGEGGAELGPGQIGEVFFETEQVAFRYHNAPEKTRAAQHPEHENWTCLGDIGYVDQDGFLFLTDRKFFTIISGGVNIYPQEVENHLVLHPKVYSDIDEIMGYYERVATPG